MPVLKINGVAIPTPQTYQWGLQDIDSEDGSGRNQDGELFRDRIARKRKLVCTWPPMEPEEMSFLLKAMTPEFFTLEYPDAEEGCTIEGTFHVGDRTSPLYMWNEEKKKKLWTGLSANFVEK